jgi:hypothetical protein
MLQPERIPAKASVMQPDDDAAIEEAASETEEQAEPAPAPRKRKKRTGARLRTREEYEEPQGRRWTTGHVVVALAVGLGIGLLFGYQSRGRPELTPPRAEVTQAPAEGEGVGPLATAPAAPPGAGDKFGRPAGDQHFGHDHPPEPTPGAAPGPAPAPPAAGGADKFGRAPGSEHYGHDHP